MAQVDLFLDGAQRRRQYLDYPELDLLEIHIGAESVSVANKNIGS